MDTIKHPHHELSYDEAARRHVDSFTVDEIRKFDKQAAVHYARAVGLQETGMSVNEIGLLFDLLESRKDRKINIVELGRNYGCSTRIFLQHVVRHGGSFESWDLKHWGDLKGSFARQGFFIEDRGADYLLHENADAYLEGRPALAYLRTAHSIKTPVTCDERFVDFLLIDTEHGLEHALGEYMRWREYVRSGGFVAFHDSTLPGPARAIEIVKEVEALAAPGRLVADHHNERVDGYGIQILEWRG